MEREGDFERAIPKMEAAYREAGCIRCFQDVIGMVYMAAGHNDKAIAAFERFRSASALFALNSSAGLVGPALEWLAELYVEAGDTDKAIEALTRLVKRWEVADSRLQPRVRAAEARIDELLLERSREPAPVG